MDSASPKSPLDDGEIGDDESKEFNDGYDENLMGDEEDRQRLALMTEKEREQELFNRSERRETLKIRFEIERKLRTKAKKREAEKKPSKQARGRKRLRASEIYSSDGSSEESDEYTPDANSKILSENSSNPKMTTRSALLMSSSSSSSSSASSASESSSSDSDIDNGAFEEDDDSQIAQEDFEMTLADIKSLQLKRDRIEEWIYAPFFKETVTGLYVKISVGNLANKQHNYKIGQIMSINRQSKIYPLNPLQPDRNKTDLYCLVQIGQVERTYQMSFISNRTFDEEDFEKWRTDGHDKPTRELFTKKKQDLHNAINFHFKDEDIIYQIEQKKRFNEFTYNFALKKTDLLAEKAEAESEMDYEKAQAIQRQIDELEEKARELERLRSSEKFSGISIVNERNRERNINESERVLKESKEVKTEDPFTRRKCMPTIVHNKNNTSTSKDPTNKQNNDKDKNLANTDKKDKSQDSNDLFQVHSSIEIDIEI